MRRARNLAVIAAVCAALSALVVGTESTPTAAWRAAAGVFAYLLLAWGIVALARRFGWSRWGGRVVWFATAIGGYLVAAGVAGRAYGMLGLAALVYCVSDAWERYRQTDHFRTREHTPIMRAVSWIMTFEDPDGIKLRAKKPR